MVDWQHQVQPLCSMFAPSWEILIVGIFNETTVPYPFSLLSAGFSFYTYTMGLGTTLGYHRLLTHKSLKVPRWVMYFILSGGYLGLMGSPIVWVAVHRLHHQKSDQMAMPHSPRDGFKHALVGWMFNMKEVTASGTNLKNKYRILMQDPILRKFGYDHEPEQARRLSLLLYCFPCSHLFFPWSS